MTNLNPYILKFNEIDLTNIPQVGGKNASLGEMIMNLTDKGIRVPEGFATTAQAYWDFLDANDLRRQLQNVLNQLDTKTYGNLDEISTKARQLILDHPFPEQIVIAISDAYLNFCSESGISGEVAVRSSATAEDLPNASFAGQQETYLNVTGAEEVIKACQK